MTTGRINQVAALEGTAARYLPSPSERLDGRASARGGHSRGAKFRSLFRVMRGLLGAPRHRLAFRIRMHERQRVIHSSRVGVLGALEPHQGPARA